MPDRQRPVPLKDKHKALRSPLILAVLAGGFVWIVFDSLALGILAAAATFFLSRRDQRSDGKPRDE